VIGVHGKVNARIMNDLKIAIGAIHYGTTGENGPCVEKLFFLLQSF